MAPKRVVAGIDLGSTSLRVRLWCPDDDKIHPVQSRDFRQYNSRYTLGDFSTTCHPFDTCGEVYLGEDIDPTRDAVSLKYEQGLKQLFSRVFDRIRVWKVETTEIYRDIVQSVLPDNSIEMFFVTETEALAHFLCRNYRDLILKQPSPVGNDTILFLDFGGHSMNSCIYHVSNTGGNDDTRSFFLIGDAVGAGGGSEQWEHYVAQEAIKYIEVYKGRRGAMSPKHKHDLRDQFDRDKGRYALEENKEFQFEAVRGLDGKELEISLGHTIINSCFERAMENPLQKAREQFERLVSAADGEDAWVAVAGGTAQHPGIRERIGQLCQEHGTHPPVFIDLLEIDEQATVRSKSRKGLPTQ
ncbi:hypothetical protein UCREL1_2735 [Eutypa lata UCREL1]|uniref:Uncharacterized protein n=1 Tax=Eutypa lata (strain UCR-EL1) TaxID=1287681 RepID=M7T123_EUTLA|nr:hypothetical protein UCREL1_2735 [Eutypa lata UCREL1]